MFQNADRFVARIRALECFQTRPGINVVGYVRSTGAQASDAATVTPLYASIKLALAACTAGRDNVIYVLPGHSETVTTDMMSSAVAGTSVIGIGEASQSTGPTLLWTAASSNVAVAVANITFANLRMLADADNITQAITVTAAGFKMVDCYVDGGVSSVKDFLIFLGISTGADNALIAANTMRATTGGNTALIITQGTATDGLTIVGNHIFGSSQSTTLGQVIFAPATTNLLVAGNIIDQQVASGTAAINIADVAATGVVANNFVTMLAATGELGTKGILLAGTTFLLAHFFDNKNSDGMKGTSGILTPVVTS